MNTITFYHAACPVCIEAEQQILKVIDTSRFEVSKVHLGEEKELINEAESLGVKSVPALVIDKTVFHLNFGAAVKDLKGS